MCERKTDKIFYRPIYIFLGLEKLTCQYSGKPSELITCLRDRKKPIKRVAESYGQYFKDCNKMGFIHWDNRIDKEVALYLGDEA